MKMRAPATESPEEAIVSVSSTPVRSDYARMSVVKSQSDLLSRLQCFLPGAGRVEGFEIDGCETPRCVGEFWTSKQRQAASISEISYRACFKPQLPRFFIELLTQKSDTVYDPFSGRGTTAIEAGLLGRSIIANDANPLSAILAGPRFAPPDLARLETRLAELPFSNEFETEIDLSMFFHPQALMVGNYRSCLESQRRSWIG
jgi:hypothetical protein